MNTKLLNDDAMDDVELNCLMNKILTDNMSEQLVGTKTHSSPDSRRAVDSFMEDKLLREQIEDPLFDTGFY